MSPSLSHACWQLCTCTGLCQTLWAEGCYVPQSYPTRPYRRTGRTYFVYPAVLNRSETKKAACTAFWKRQLGGSGSVKELVNRNSLDAEGLHCWATNQETSLKQTKNTQMIASFFTSNRNCSVLQERWTAAIAALCQMMFFLHWMRALKDRENVILPRLSQVINEAEMSTLIMYGLLLWYHCAHQTNHCNKVPPGKMNQTVLTQVTVYLNLSAWRLQFLVDQAPPQ